MLHRKAFTLIELLVVIAIIAILAAILFPVFAKARESARGASSQSNLKQISLAVLMYVQDYDESYPMLQAWPTSGGHVCWGGCAGGFQWTSWAFDVAPYVKASAVYSDPLAGNPAQDAWTQTVLVNYGYNYCTLSPYKGAFGSTPWTFAGTGLGAINKPAETVMLGGRMVSREIGSYWYGAGTMVSEGTLEPPDCDTIPSWCFASWTDGSNWAPILPTDESGKYTGGDSLRKALNANFSFTDGHCKFMNAGQGAAGTNWYRAMPVGTLRVLDYSKYLWQVM